MSHRVLVFVTTAAVLAVSTVAGAGAYSPQAAWVYTSIWENETYGGGVLRDTRDTNDTISTVGCQITAFPQGKYGFCIAVDADGVMVACYTDSEDFISMITGISEHSAIDFSVSADQMAVCQVLSVHNYSNYLPAN